MRKFIALSMIAALACASQAASLKEGTQEIVVNGLFDPSALGGTAWSLGGSYGYFIQDNVEVGGSLALADTEDVGSTYDIAAFAEYNFDQGNEVVPFVGASVAYKYLDLEDVDSDNAVVGTVSAGVKYFLAENVAIRAAANASIASEDVYADDDDVTDNDFNVTLGMAFYIP
jgi:opacity protein-like surface antigen